MMKSSEIRQAFLEYFSKNQHQIVPSSPLIPENDPTLLFTNAGMVQFKDTFLGMESRPYRRAVSSQRCLRAGGKHNDLENVGYTARHHTFFEMLGNFSFGDYFKKEAIQYAWKFLTTVLKLPKERLWITVYKDDDEAADIWLKEIGVSAERLSRCGEKDNFWSMGETGPCGPCTEIFYDHGPEIAGGPPGSEEEDGDRYIEIWNLVFMQYNRDQNGTLHPLPHPSVDTGMGLERIAAVVQGVHNNYHIDSFQHIINAIASLAPKVDKEHPSLKVIADHIRASSFLICDGVIPGNEGRGYVLRRIIRRAVRHGHKLGLPSPFFSKLVPALINVLGDAYPELIKQQQTIIQLLNQEEEQFNRTLEQGLRLLQEEIDKMKGNRIAGETAFKLYDTYGFPIDLTADIAREQGLEIDIDGFHQCMKERRQLSQSHSHFNTDYYSIAHLEQETDFHGYDKDSLQSKIEVILIDGESKKQLKKGMKGAVILDHTPFYAESGGQVGDQGLISAKDTRFRVADTQKIGKTIVHFGEVEEGELQLHQTVYAEIDSLRRHAIRLNHTATHLLHAALKEIIGEHVQQKGSLVDADRARFDFSHYEPLSAEQIHGLETLVNEKIRENVSVTTEIMDIDNAKKSGAVALFGEKYDEKVRVLSMGAFSKELCGGTHAKRTGDIGLFKIISEYGIASGIRRLEMVTGKYALEWVDQQQEILKNIASALKTTTEHVKDKVESNIQENKKLEKEVSRLQDKLAYQAGQELTTEIESIGNVGLLIKRLEAVDMKALRRLLDQFKSKLTSAIIILYTINDNKISVVAGMNKQITNIAPKASDLVKKLCGKGGGRDDMAQGGGELPEDFDKRLSEIKSMIEGAQNK